MRPSGRGPLDSLYFRYPSFTAKDVPELHGPGAKHRVVIVGAGPIGMTSALILARHGVPSVLLESKDTFNDGSRAICISRSSMHILERAGAVRPFVDKALGWTHGRSYYRGTQIYRLEMPHSASEKYLPMYNLQQQYIEQFLHDAVARQPLIDMRWQSEVAEVQPREDGVALQIRSPKGDYALDADHVLAADGARSAIRSMLGLRLKGENYEGRYVIADVQMKHDFPTERRAFFEPAGNPGGTVLVHKQPDDIWRVDYQLHESESAEEAVREDNIRRRVQSILGDIGHAGPWALEWWSIYTANTLCLDDYRHGRVIFIGDSAHIVPIFGVRGLNNGLADAHNAAWKLAYVLKGIAAPGLLDSYTPERRGATLDVFANATKSTRFMTPPTRGWRLAREAALSLAVKHEFTRGFANPRQMLPYAYAQSPITVPDADETPAARGPVAGSASPNARLADGRFLLDLAGDGFTVLYFVDRPLSAQERSLFDGLRQLDPTLELCVIGGDALPDPDRAIAGIFAANVGSVVLLRPDQHIAGRWRSLRADDLQSALRRALGRIE
jgi:3-(3-hydroxy-phenyl)propionate hydroxylase